ncbi:phospholipase A2 inhibitor and Ly6/PLAUR domain-containing protein-like [Heteronotia binoei]|uniref:phospholipase A2 inhibitor and Ly6/PLAUR domain-containing protein-like n=1 Tax=Heteronotia binoei TaxID=13085 RepID=UPI00292FDDCB|nr:phospholipase A2 inhibitor and Ly6/PLAUR domain-containing protein-like [Heteronotia binoei]
MAAPVFFFLLAALLAVARRGSSIECKTCFALNGNCTGHVRVCEPEFDACSSLVVETKTSTKTQRTIRKKCVIHSQCVPGAIFMDLGIGYQESGVSDCCITDRCNTVFFTIPTRNKTLNGLRCPFCHAEGYEKCKEEVIDCRGLETQCFTRGAGGQTVSTVNSVTTVSYEITQKGCATKPFCANIAETGSFISGNSVTVGAQDIQCRAASREARPTDSGGQKTSTA